MMYPDVTDDAHRHMILIGRTLEQWLLEDARRQPDRQPQLTPEEFDRSLDRFLDTGVHEFHALVAAAAQRLRSHRGAA